MVGVTQRALQEYATDYTRLFEAIRRRRAAALYALTGDDNHGAIYIWHQPRPPEAFDDDVDPEPWLSVRADATRDDPEWERHSVDDVADLLDMAASYSQVRPTWCGACQRPLPDGQAIKSMHDWLTEGFCSAYCLHEAEHELEATLSPTVAGTDYASVFVKQSWPDDHPRVDAHRHPNHDNGGA